MTELKNACEKLSKAMKVAEPETIRITIKTVFPDVRNEYTDSWLSMFAMRNSKLVRSSRMIDGTLTLIVNEENIDLLCEKFRDFNEDCNCIYNFRG